MIDLKQYLSTPIEVTWDITRRCNLSCSFCLENSVDASCPEDVSERTRQIIADEIIKCRPLILYISGGEPFLLPQLEDYVSSITKGGSEVIITSNGLLITEERARRLAEARVRRVDITVYPEVMEKSFKAINILQKAGVKVVPRAVFTRKMKDSLPDFLSACIGAGLKKIVMQEVIPLGRGMNDFDRYTLSETEVKDAIAEVTSFQEKHSDFIVEFNSSILAECEADGATACVIPLEIRKSCEIRPQGNVIPCYVAMIYGIENNLLKKGLKQCWLDIPKLYSQGLTTSTDISCSRCHIQASCPGGCPAEHEEYIQRGISSAGSYCRFYEHQDK